MTDDGLLFANFHYSIGNFVIVCFPGYFAFVAVVVVTAADASVVVYVVAVVVYVYVYVCFIWIWRDIALYRYIV